MADIINIENHNGEIKNYLGNNNVKLDEVLLLHNKCFDKFNNKKCINLKVLKFSNIYDYIDENVIIFDNNSDVIYTPNEHSHDLMIDILTYMIFNIEKPFIIDNPNCIITLTFGEYKMVKNGDMKLYIDDVEIAYDMDIIGHKCITYLECANYLYDTLFTNSVKLDSIFYYNKFNNIKDSLIKTIYDNNELDNYTIKLQTNRIVYSKIMAEYLRHTSMEYDYEKEVEEIKFKLDECLDTIKTIPTYIMDSVREKYKLYGKDGMLKLLSIDTEKNTKLSDVKLSAKCLMESNIYESFYNKNRFLSFLKGSVMESEKIINKIDSQIVETKQKLGNYDRDIYITYYNTINDVILNNIKKYKYMVLKQVIDKFLSIIDINIKIDDNYNVLSNDCDISDKQIFNIIINLAMFNLSLTSHVNILIVKDAISEKCLSMLNTFITNTTMVLPKLIFVKLENSVNLVITEPSIDDTGSASTCLPSPSSTNSFPSTPLTDSFYCDKCSTIIKNVNKSKHLNSIKHNK